MNLPLKVTIIILNWNGRDNTLECLKSVTGINYNTYEVVVVDNGSQDDSVSAIRNTFPHITLIKTGENLGYAGGNNVGIRYALDQGTDFVFILNNDTKIASDALSYLVQEAQKHPKAAVLGPIVYEMERPEIIWTAGEAFGETFTCIHLKSGEPEATLKQKESYEVEGVIGAAFFIKAAVLSEIGLFDERFFLVHEESDWCFRARRRGYTCRIVPQAKVWHSVAGSFGGESSPLRAYFSTRNQLLFAERNLPKSTWLRLLRRSIRRLFPKWMAPEIGPEPFAKRLYWSLRDSLSLWQDPRQKAIRQGVLDYLMRRFGDCPAKIRALNASSPKPMQRKTG